MMENGAAAAAILANASKAMGIIVRVETSDFLIIVNENEEPIVVHATGGFFKQTEQYLTSYRGLAFFTKSEYPLSIPSHCQVVKAKKISVPDF